MPHLVTKVSSWSGILEVIGLTSDLYNSLLNLAVCYFLPCLLRFTEFCREISYDRNVSLIQVGHYPTQLYSHSLRSTLVDTTFMKNNTNQPFSPQKMWKGQLNLLSVCSSIFTLTSFLLESRSLKAF